MRSEIDWDNDTVDFEPEEEMRGVTNDSIDEKPFDADKIRYELKTISVRQMYDMINDGQLDLSPGFQRRTVWKEAWRKSLLIESLMLRIPLPGFYVYEDEDAMWHVVDGLQRLSTIKEYLDEKFTLSGLDYLQHSNGLVFGQLDQKYKNRITTTSLVINIIDSRTPSQVKLEIFRRINTGGIPLNAQEIRNSVAKTKTRDFLSLMVSSQPFIQATNGGINDLRMQAQELVIRFLAFWENYDVVSGEVAYKRNMESFLDKAFERLNKCTDQELIDYRESFLTAMTNSYMLFGKYAFRRVDSLNEPNHKLKPYNKSLFTCCSVILSHYNTQRLANMNLEDSVLVRLVHEIANDREFSESLSKGTGDVTSINIQFGKMRKIMKEMIGDAE